METNDRVDMQPSTLEGEKNKTYQGWAVIISDGRGWDLDIGAVSWPRSFLTVNMANDYADKIRNHKKWRNSMLPKLLVVPVVMTIDL